MLLASSQLIESIEGLEGALVDSFSEADDLEAFVNDQSSESAEHNSTVTMTMTLMIGVTKKDQRLRH